MNVGKVREDDSVRYLKSAGIFAKNTFVRVKNRFV